jgi:competence protein ComEA
MRALQARSDRTPVPSFRAPKVDAAGAEGRSAILGAARWRVWVPILTKVVAFGLALLGLAGIGMAASRSPAVSELATAPLGATFAHLAGPTREPPVAAAHVPSASAGPAASSPRVEAAPPAEPESPCPKGPPARAVAGEQDAPSAGSPGGAGVLADGRVVLNLATATELLRLPGVGAKRAEAIVQLRQRLGRFKRPSDLLRIKGIGPRTLERMLPHLVVDP